MRRRGPENINFWWGMWWIAVAIFFLGIVCLLTGCCEKKAEAKETGGKRFSYTFIEKTTMPGGAIRRFYELEDTVTGNKYLCVVGSSSTSIALMPQPVAQATISSPCGEIHLVEEETFTGETEPMVFSSAPTATGDKLEPVEEEPVSVIRNNDGVKGDLELLALVIYQEAGGDMCSDETRQMVGEVVLNRVADKRYPCTIEGVITQPYQYGLLHKTGPVWPERADNPGEQHAVERAYETAWALLIDDVERLLPEDVIYQAEFEQGKETVAEADGFYFCR